jgi:hypothetical protein
MGTYTGNPLPYRDWHYRMDTIWHLAFKGL